MTVELRPLGIKCNIQCHYCYQNPQRDAGNILHNYDLDLMKKSVEREGGPFTIFGGEPLVIPESILENLWEWGLNKYGTNGIQTNGVLINDNHIQLFKKYKVKVGVSIDGPDELNDVRWAGSLSRTREATKKSLHAIEKLVENGIIPSLIITLHQVNASSKMIAKLCEWIKGLDSLGIKGVRLHVLEAENEFIRLKYSLSPQENITVFSTLLSLESELKNIKFIVFKDMRNLMLGEDSLCTCVWNACDPYTTRAVRGVEGNGQRSNCGRTNKEGIDFVKSSYAGYERYIALYNTPQEFGGCKSCRFFLVCKGQCPGTAIDGDWRNRTEYCEVWKKLFINLEYQLLNEGKIPISVHSLRTDLEKAFISNWSKGNNLSIESTIRSLKQERNQL